MPARMTSDPDGACPVEELLEISPPDSLMAHAIPFLNRVDDPVAPTRGPVALARTGATLRNPVIAEFPLPRETRRGRPRWWAGHLDAGLPVR